MGQMEVGAMRASGECEGGRKKRERKGVREKASALNFVFAIKQN